MPIASSFVLPGQNAIRFDIVSTNPAPSAPVSLSKKAQARLESEQRFERYESRIKTYVRKFFTADDRRLIGEAYEIAEDKKLDLTKIDKLVHELGAFRILQHLRGELVMVAVKQALGDEDDDEAPPQVDLAHLPLLGKIRQMTGAGG